MRFSSLDNISHRVIPDLRRSKFISFDRVGVDGKSDIRVGVTEALRYGWDRDTAAQQFTRVRVAQGMQAHALKACTFHEDRNATSDAAGVVVSAAGLTENEVILLVVLAEHFAVPILFRTVLTKGVERGRWHSEAPRPSGFRAFHPKASLCLFERFRHVHDAGFEIDVGPLQSEQLATAGAARERQHNERVKARIAGALKEFSGAALFDHLRRLLRHLRKLNAGHRVAVDHLPFQSLLEAAMDHRGDMPNRLR